MAELIEELFELETDLREALHRKDDGWGDPDDPDLLMDPVDFAAKHDIEPDQIVICDAEIKTGVNHDRHIAETQMFNAGAKAREKVKATAASRAQDRRTFNMKRNRDSRLSETQAHDVWDDNDPKNW